MAHHTIVKKAAAKGIIFEDGPEGSDYRFRAFWPERSMELWGNNASDLCNNAILARMHTIENGLKFEQDDGNVTVLFKDNTLGEIDAEADPKEFADAVAEALDAITDEMRAGIVAEDAEEEDEPRTGSVVPVKYKVQYKDAGHPNHCGDWLAETLNQYCLIHDAVAKRDVTNVDAVDAIAQANGVNTEKWNRTTKGWQGRLRMSMRNALIKFVVSKGVLLIPGGIADDELEIPAPTEWLLANSRKQAAAKEAGTKKKKGA